MNNTAKPTLNGVHPDTAPAADANRRRAGRRWVMVPIALFLAQACFIGTMLYLATSDPTFAVEPDYYQKALDWDATAAQRRANERLAWRTDLDVTGTPAAGRELSLRLTTATGVPLEGAAVHAEVFASARSRDRRTLELAARGDGRYAAPLDTDRSGHWACRLRITRGPETFTADLDFMVPARGGGRP